MVTAHGNRGLHGSLSIEAGITPRAVADALGLESFKQTTAKSYVPVSEHDPAETKKPRKSLDLRGLPVEISGIEPLTS